VWYSSTWSDATLDCFRNALAHVLEEGDPSMEVLAHLVHWQLHDVPRTQALAEWVRAWDEGAVAAVGCLARRPDRIALIQYYLSGELLGGGPNGSPVMFSQPPKLHRPLEDQHSFLNTITFTDLSERVGSGVEGDIVCAGEALLLESVGRLVTWIREGSVVIAGVQHATVALDNPAVLAEIAGHRPWTVSWSNVLDFTRDFHTLARAVSGVGGTDTIHIAYSLNWRHMVQGTSMLDYAHMPALRREYLGAGRRHLPAYLDALRGTSSVHLFTEPLPTNPLNITEYLLTRQFHSTWVDWFFREGAVQVPRSQVVIADLAPFNPLGRHTVVDLEWTYDPDIVFRRPGRVRGPRSPHHPTPRPPTGGAHCAT
jgi:hypothetical protein